MLFVSTIYGIISLFRLKRNEFRLGLLLNLENSTWEDDFSLLQLDDTHLTKQQQIMEQATTVTYDYKSGIVNPEMWKKPLVDYKAIEKKKKVVGLIQKKLSEILQQ